MEMYFPEMEWPEDPDAAIHTGTYSAEEAETWIGEYEPWIAEAERQG